MATNNALNWCMPCYINGHIGDGIGSVSYVDNISHKVDWLAWSWGCRHCVMRLVIRDVTMHYMGLHIIGCYLAMNVILNVSSI